MDCVSLVNATHPRVSEAELASVIVAQQESSPAQAPAHPESQSAPEPPKYTADVLPSAPPSERIIDENIPLQSFSKRKVVVGGAVLLGAVAAVSITIFSVLREPNPQNTPGAHASTAAPQAPVAPAGNIALKPSSAAPQAAKAIAVGERAGTEPSKPVAESQPSVTHAAEFPLSDGSETKAPSCEDLLSGPQAEPYNDAKAAYDQIGAAHRALVRGKLEPAHTAFCRAALWQGATANIFLDLSQFYLLRRDAQAAVHWAERALRVEAENARALALLGDALIQTGKLEQAKNAWVAAATRVTPEAAALGTMVQGDFEQAQRAFKQRDYSRAERFFRRVVAFRPDDAAAASGVSASLRKQGLKKSAEIWSLHAQDLLRRKNP